MAAAPLRASVHSWSLTFPSPLATQVRVMDAEMEEYHPFLAARGKQLCQVFPPARAPG